MKSVKVDPSTARQQNILLSLCVLGVIGLFVYIFRETPIGIKQSSHGDTSTPDLYELTRQTAENTRHIFWLLVVGFVCLFGLLRKNKAT